MSKKSKCRVKFQRAADGENAVRRSTLNGLTSATRTKSRRCREFNPLPIDHV